MKTIRKSYSIKYIDFSLKPRDSQSLLTFYSLWQWCYAKVQPILHNVIPLLIIPLFRPTYKSYLEDDPNMYITNESWFCFVSYLPVVAQCQNKLVNTLQNVGTYINNFLQIYLTVFHPTFVCKCIIIASWISSHHVRQTSPRTVLAHTANIVAKPQLTASHKSTLILMLIL